MVEEQCQTVNAVNEAKCIQGDAVSMSVFIDFNNLHLISLSLIPWRRIRRRRSMQGNRSHVAMHKIKRIRNLIAVQKVKDSESHRGAESQGESDAFCSAESVGDSQSHCGAGSAGPLSV